MISDRDKAWNMNMWVVWGKNKAGLAEVWHGGWDPGGVSWKAFKVSLASLECPLH